MVKLYSVTLWLLILSASNHLRLEMRLGSLLFSKGEQIRKRYSSSSIKTENVGGKYYFGAALIFCTTAFIYVFVAKQSDWKLSFRGVEKDIARQRAKLGLDSNKEVPSLKDS